MKERGQRHLISAEDFVFAEEMLKTLALAALLEVPVIERTQRQAFKDLLPRVMEFREKGLTWKEVTRQLNESGFNLKPSTVRSYFSSMAPKTA